jgi:hypothetical protein
LNFVAVAPTIEFAWCGKNLVPGFKGRGTSDVSGVSSGVLLLPSAFHSDPIYLDPGGIFALTDTLHRRHSN